MQSLIDEQNCPKINQANSTKSKENFGNTFTTQFLTSSLSTKGFSDKNKSKIINPDFIFSNTTSTMNKTGFKYNAKSNIDQSYTFTKKKSFSDYINNIFDRKKDHTHKEIKSSKATTDHNKEVKSLKATTDRNKEINSIKDNCKDITHQAPDLTSDNLDNKNNDLITKEIKIEDKSNIMSKNFEKILSDTRNNVENYVNNMDKEKKEMSPENQVNSEVKVNNIEIKQDENLSDKLEDMSNAYIENKEWMNYLFVKLGYYILLFSYI